MIDLQTPLKNESNELRYAYTKGKKIKSNVCGGRIVVYRGIFIFIYDIKNYL